MSGSAAQTLEAEPLKGQQEEMGAPDARGCTGKMGMSKLSGWRTAVFLLSLFLCLSVVFAFSFILPCPVRPQYLPTWSLNVIATEAYNFLGVGDASTDKVLDIFLIFKSSKGHMNQTCIKEGLSSPCLFLLAVDGTHGTLLWERPLAVEFNWAECGVGGVNDKGGELCVVAHTNNITAIDIQTGMIRWQVSHSLVANGNLPVISLPDLNNDKTNDIAVLSYSPTDTVAELMFFSGRSGEMIGSKVIVDVAPGKMRSHLQLNTASEAPYILLHTDRGLYALSLGRLAASARSDLDSSLKREESWEQAADSEGIIMLYNSVSLMSVLKVTGGYLSSTPSLLLLTDSTVMLFDTHNLYVTWTANTSNLVSTPSFGHFNKDGVPDIVLEEDQGNGSKRVVILDGQKGSVLWEVLLLLHPNNPQPGSLLTLSDFSVFMFWGETHTFVNSTSFEEEKWSSYLLYPLHPDVLLERKNATHNIITFKALLLERGRHASYLILASEDRAQNRTVLTKRKIKGDIDESSVVRVGGDGKLNGDTSKQEKPVKEAFYRLRFSDQTQ